MPGFGGVRFPPALLFLILFAMGYASYADEPAEGHDDGLRTEYDKESPELVADERCRRRLVRILKDWCAWRRECQRLTRDLK